MFKRWFQSNLEEDQETGKSRNGETTLEGSAVVLGKGVLGLGFSGTYGDKETWAEWMSV